MEGLTSTPFSGHGSLSCKGKKNPWPAFPITITAYNVSSFKEVEAEAKEMKGLYFVISSHCTYDPIMVVETHWKKANFNWSYPHARKYHEDKVKNLYNVARDFSPSEQQEKEDENSEQSQENVCL